MQLQHRPEQWVIKSYWLWSFNLTLAPRHGFQAWWHFLWTHWSNILSAKTTSLLQIKAFNRPSNTILNPFHCSFVSFTDNWSPFVLLQTNQCWYKWNRHWMYVVVISNQTRCKIFGIEYKYNKKISVREPLYVGVWKFLRLCYHPSIITCSLFLVRVTRGWWSPSQETSTLDSFSVTHTQPRGNSRLVYTPV